MEIPEGTQYVVAIAGRDQIQLNKLSAQRGLMASFVFTLQQGAQLVDELTAALEFLGDYPQFGPRYIASDPHA